MYIQELMYLSMYMVCSDALKYACIYVCMNDISLQVSQFLPFSQEKTLTASISSYNGQITLAIRLGGSPLRDYCKSHTFVKTANKVKKRSARCMSQKSRMRDTNITDASL
jgi:hypothetical protein